MSNRSPYTRLTNLLSKIEDDLLKVSSREILSDEGATKAEKKVSGIIRAAITTKTARTNAAIPKSIKEKRRLLEIILGAGRSMPTEIRMAYGDGKNISDSEVSTLLSKLLRSGFGTRDKKQ